MRIKFDKTEEYPSYDDATKRLQELVPEDTSQWPSEIPCVFYREGDIKYECWHGLRSLQDGPWTCYDKIAFSPDGITIHLSEYWASDKGIYKKI